LNSEHGSPHSALVQRVLNWLMQETTVCYIAGGYVREMLLGQPAKDIDLVVPTGAIPLARRLADATGGAFYALDTDTDAARIVYRRPDELVVDLAAMRGPDIVADLQARDFTINAMAVDVRHSSQAQPAILDPCHGQQDLARRVLRATSEQAFQQDPVRLLRAVRFAARLGLSIEPQTEAWLERDAPLVTQPSGERIRQELALIIGAAGAAHHLHRMDELGLLHRVLPEVAALKGVAQSPPHLYDVYEHTLRTVTEAERLSAFPDVQLAVDEEQVLGPFAAELGAHLAQTLSEHRTRATLLKFAALLHDLGKPATRALDGEGTLRFFGHERTGAEMASQVLTRLRFSAREIRLVSTVVACHMRPEQLAKEQTTTPRAIYRFFREAGDAGIETLLLFLADQLAKREASPPTPRWDAHLRLVQVMLESYYRRPSEVVSPPHLVDGQDIMQVLGLGPGPQIGELLEAVREAQADGLVWTREEALAFLRRV